MVHTAQSQSHVKPQAPNSSAAQYGGGFGQPNAQKLLAQGDVDPANDLALANKQRKITE